MKVSFVHKYEDGSFEVERLWCKSLVDNKCVIDNIPFIARRVSLGDTIKIEYDKEEQAYYFDDFVEISGNSTIRLYFEDQSMIEEVRQQLNQFGCESEVFLQRKIVAVNVPKEVEYKPVKAYLDDGEKNGLWEYEESCLCHET